MVWEGINTRGPHTIEVTKVLGHATERDVELGKSTHELRRGNRNVDEAATEGTAAHKRGFVDLTQWLAERHKKDQTFTRSIQAMIASIIMREKEERTNATKTNNIFHGKNYMNTTFVTSTPTYAHPNNIIKILWFKRSLLGTRVGRRLPGGGKQGAEVEDCGDQIDNSDTKAKEIRHSLHNAEFAQCQPGTNGIIWLELFIIYTIRRLGGMRHSNAGQPVDSKGKKRNRITQKNNACKTAYEASLATATHPCLPRESLQKQLMV